MTGLKPVTLSPKTTNETGATLHLMGCTECEENEGERMKVEYIDGATETVELCDGCQEEFEVAELVATISETEAEGHLEAED